MYWWFDLDSPGLSLNDSSLSTGLRVLGFGYTSGNSIYEMSYFVSSGTLILNSITQLAIHLCFLVKYEESVCFRQILSTHDLRWVLCSARAVAIAVAPSSPTRLKLRSRTSRAVSRLNSAASSRAPSRVIRLLHEINNTCIAWSIWLLCCLTNHRINVLLEIQSCSTNNQWPVFTLLGTGIIWKIS